MGAAGPSDDEVDPRDDSGKRKYGHTVGDDLDRVPVPLVRQRRRAPHGLPFPG
ncbi:hypothetical protein SBD_1791 [Streptomyces bottropensis ATCC 25435]|uniref:Uncharacterized protein n=1 Tax=Streptomyces bottropensis ATCC 25435 TaxID=1054862 RepID=M3F558_9ACTN|nr:hypothetical protein SBD_1791 [Streptomyces bottropensis ATCC 25435]